MAASLNDQIETRPEENAMLSSEMLFGFSPDVIYDLLPSLKTRQVNVLVYLRRQDRYIEAVYLQKAKNARFFGNLSDYIHKFQGSGSDYMQSLSGWMASNATLVPRVMERPKLIGQSVVTDALAQIGLPWEDVVEEPDNNVSPGIHRVQLLQAVALSKFADPRKLQRRLASLFPQQPQERGQVMTQLERRKFLDMFADSNEMLRAKYFSKEHSLFDEQDLEKPRESTGIAPFTDAQLVEIVRVLEVVKSFN